MSLIIILFGGLIFLAGLLIFADPEKVFGLFKPVIENPGVHVLAVGTRLVLGTLLILQAGDSRYPLAIEVIGWIAIIAGIVLAIIGRNRFKQLMGWALSKAKSLGRIGGIAATGFGAFLVYAFI